MSNSIFDMNMLDPNGHERFRHLLTSNRIADRQPFAHHIRFPHDGYQSNIMQHFRPGDTIQLLPTAYYPAWCNYVHSAKMTLTFLANDLDDLSPQTTESIGIAEYPYRPLQALLETRVLLIQPGLATAPLTCELQHVDLGQGRDHDYEAISYCWGNEIAKQQIVLSGQPFRISANLYDCLMQLRSSTDAVRKVWVDAVCINQLDSAERASQVRIMQQIYAAAACVIVWLSDGIQQTHQQNIAVVRDTLDLDKHVNVKSLPPEKETAVQVEDEELMNLDHDADISQGLADQCTNLTRDSWCSRVWVLQEVFSAKQIMVMCGSQTFSWALLLRINARARALRHTLAQVLPCMPELFTSLFILAKSTRPVADCLPGRYTYMLRPPTSDFLDILIAGLDLDATDPRDKLFALLPFAPADSLDDLDIHIDYNKDVALHYRDFTRSWIVSRKSLRILSAVHCSLNRTWLQWMPGLPTTVNPLRTSWSFWYDGRTTFRNATLGVSTATTYSASGTSVIDVELISRWSDSSILPLRGHTLNTIANIERFPYYDAIFGDPAVRTKYANFVDVYTKVFDCNNGMKVYSRGSFTSANKLPNASPQHTWNHMKIHYSVTGQRQTIDCHSDSLFTATNGTLGLCPHTARAGDLVVALNGGHVPYLLRPLPLDSEVCTRDPQTHDTGVLMQFIGECFVPEYMDGSAAMSRSVVTELFLLR